MFTNDLTQTTTSPFDAIRHIDDNGNEYWIARELMGLLGYNQYRGLTEAIDRAIVSCQIQGKTVEDHFALVRDLVVRPQGGGRKREDCKLSRYGAYLTVLNGDPRKPEIAAAQAYFVTKTREAEIREQQQVIEPPKPMTAIEILQIAVNQLAEQEKRQQELEKRQQELEQHQQQTDEALAQLFRARLEATERRND